MASTSDARKESIDGWIGNPDMITDTVDNGGANKVGPNLWNVVNSPIAADDDFSYSSSFKEYAEGKTWTYEELNGFLFKPKSHIKGTAMGFAGLKKTDERANLIGWLRTHSDNPQALPGS